MTPNYPQVAGVGPNDWRNVIVGPLAGAAPSNSDGIDGNYWVDSSTGNLWGPKASGAWPGAAAITFSPGTNTIFGSIAGATPASNVGQPGDYFVDLFNGTYWGPKGSTAWTGTAAPLLLGGPNTIFGNSSGGPPSSGIGVNGMYFFDTSASVFYGPKASGAWPLTGAAVAGGSNTIFGDSGGVPDNILGLNGDYFYDTSGQNYYGPKVSDAWPTSPSLLVPLNPANVIAGNSSGAAPSSDVGVAGDYYIDISTGFIYGPNASGTWPSTGTLLVPIGTYPENIIFGQSSGSAPAGSVGNAGDYFMDMTDGSVYGPKASGLWPSSAVYTPPVQVNVIANNTNLDIGALVFANVQWVSGSDNFYPMANHTITAITGGNPQLDNGWEILPVGGGPWDGSSWATGQQFHMLYPAGPLSTSGVIPILLQRTA